VRINLGTNCVLGVLRRSAFGQEQPVMRTPTNILCRECPMSELPDSISSRGRSVWFGITVGSLAQLGLKTLLPLIVLFATRYWSLTMDSPSLWLEDPGDSRHPVWYAMQASVFVGSILAGAAAAMLVSRRSFALAVALVMLSLIATAFEQFPQPLTTSVSFIWAVGPCFGLLVGVLLGRRLTRRRTH
jgi:hypothetical protein